MRRLLMTATALVALAAPLLTAAPATAAPVEVQIKPATLERGPHVRGAHLHGTTIHDGDVRVRLDAARARLFGKWNQFYIVATGNRQWGNVKLERVAASGTTKLLVAGVDPFNTRLDPDGGQIAYSYGDTTQRPTIGVYDLAQKTEVIARSFASLPRLLDFDLGRVIASLSSFRVKTVAWDTVLDTTNRLNRKQANYASIAHNLLGFFDKDPQLGGCQVLARLANPANLKWTSCKERIEAVSPDGRRMATIPLLSDGIGPADIWARRIGGAGIAHYSINGWFGAMSWETAAKLLMRANGTVKSALVRCKVADCNRAGALSPTPDL